MLRSKLTTRRWLRKLALVLILPLCPWRAAGGPADILPPGRADGEVIYLAQAIERVLSNNPAVKGAVASVEAAGARARQAGRLSNPEVEVEFEDYGLNGEDDPMEGTVTTFRAVQTFETAGKRRKRRRTAGFEADLAGQDLAIARLNVRSQTAARFTDLLAAQERVQLLQSSMELMQRVHDATSERVDSGKLPPLELAKAKVELGNSSLELNRAQRELTIARLALASLWGASPQRAVGLKAGGELREVPRLPGLEELAARLGQSPESLRWALQEEVAAAAAAEEKAARIPDITVMAGIAQERESRDETAQVAVAIPLPLFDRNQGNVTAALAEMERVRQERIAAEQALRLELTEQWHQARAAVDDVNAVKETILPVAKTAFAAAEEAYRSGKVGYLDVVDARRTLIEAEMQMIEMCSQVHKKVADIEALLGHTIAGGKELK